ncbi:MAG: type II secretion system F family protein [Candidatus Omnitrophota bacterium]|nr:MAG: type II secretion system F family protein [Candidatus Omnitrophota bacterium]
MSVFSYTVKTKKGEVAKGNLEAESQQKALEYLHSQGNIVLRLQEEKGKKVVKKTGRVGTDELVIFSRQLTTLIESGIPVVGALDILYQQVTNPYFKSVVGGVLKDLREGSSFASSLAKYPRVFPEIYVSMVEAAETSGNLPQILERLSVYLEKMNALRKKIISSLTYPVVVVMMAIGITSFLIFKVIPTFKTIFATLGGTLPLPTQILIGFSDMLRANILWVLIIFVLAVIMLQRYISTSRGKKQYHRLLLNLPVFGDIIRKVSIAKFSRTFSTLVKSGVAITTSLDIVGKTSGNKIIEEAVLKAKQSIQEGVPISKPLEESGVFPPMVVRMIAIGEQSGKLEEMLSKIAQFYEEQTDAVISGLTSLIEPIIIGFLGIVIGGIVIALFLPIIKITQLLR